MQPIVFVFAKKGRVKCLTLDDTISHKLIKEGYVQTASLNAAAWIESLMNGDGEHAAAMMDELNFGIKI